ncbi:hypothetical protein GCM10010466_53400 [Planomonospora alba]|uniref:Uncharacterized protein n=1 Tax=Planomonospora alba TaxID=161354 RepID=A0ABP6NQG2_9ACTN
MDERQGEHELGPVPQRHALAGQGAEVVRAAARRAQALRVAAEGDVASAVSTDGLLLTRRLF